MTDHLQPLVTIIAPVFNVEQYLRNCLDSVLSQSYRNWEMILVDDGSSDGSGEICDAYSRRDSRFISLHQENAGQSSARNRALDFPPRGEFVTFLDSDDFWNKDYLAVLVDIQQKYDADIVQCGYVRGEATIFPEQEGAAVVDVFDNHSIFLRERSNVVVWGKLYKRDLFNEIRMPVGLYNEDDWTVWKIYYRSKTIVVTSKALYYYTVNPYSTMARLGKKPDLRYVNAYKERIDFFLSTGETDLEHCSRLQLCKSLLMVYCHKKLERGDRNEIMRLFNESWRVLKHSPYISRSYKVLFVAFHLMPMIVSRLVVLMKG